MGGELRRLLAIGVIVFASACSSSEDEPLVKYPDAPPGTASDPSEPPGPAEPAPAGPDAPAHEQPIVGQKLLASAVVLEGATSDGHLVFTSDADIVVLPAGAAAPVTIVKDYDFDYDSLVIRGRYVGAWLGEDIGPSALTSWSAGAGLRADGPVTLRSAIYPKSGSDLFAYKGPSASLLASKIFVTRAGQGAGTLVVPSLDNGVLGESCRPSIAWVGGELLVAGCAGGSTTRKIALYATDGSAAVKTLLDGAAPGVWVDHARARAIIQTASASQLRTLAGGAPVSLDTSLRHAVFSEDDAKVAYVRADGKVRRAATTAPTSPIDLGTGISILGVSPDGRFVAFATKRDAQTERTDVVLADASARATPLVAAVGGAIFHGFSKDGSAILYQKTTSLLADGPLVLQRTTAGGPPVEIAASAERVVFDGQVVYWQTFDKATKTNKLEAARLSAPTTKIAIDQGLDALTSNAMRVGDKLFVGSKLGLWVYPAARP